MMIYIPTDHVSGCRMYILLIECNFPLLTNGDVLHADFNVLARAEKLLVGWLLRSRSSLFTNLVFQDTTDSSTSHSTAYL